MAGSTNIAKEPYPTAAAGCVIFRLGGHVIEGAAADTVVDRLYVPWNAYVRKVVYYYNKTSTNDLDDVILLTVDDTKTIVASQDGENITIGVQTLHADVDDDAYEIEAGDYITLRADAEGTTEGGIIHAEVWLYPVYG